MSTFLSPLCDTLDTLIALADPKVIQRGEDYHRGGVVRILRRSPDGRFAAEVSASADSSYRVFVKTDGGSILDYGCDCPYDANPVCKHLVAVFRAIQCGEFDETPYTEDWRTAQSDNFIIFTTALDALEHCNNTEAKAALDIISRCCLEAETPSERKIILERCLRICADSVFVKKPGLSVSLLRACAVLVSEKNIHRFYEALDGLKSGGQELTLLRQELSARVYG